jgi:nitrogen fixation NifU-like protein
MSDLDDLYQRIILDHARAPRNERSFRGGRGERQNPLCGDEVVVSVRLDGDRIAEVGAVAQGCALSKASASLMTLAVAGRTPGEVGALDARFRALLAGGDAEGLGDLAAFAGVAKFPVRAKCATLAWDALRAALSPAA